MLTPILASVASRTDLPRQGGGVLIWILYKKPLSPWRLCRNHEGG
jgi:hypothetical protein